MDNEKNWYPKYPSIHVSKENWYPCIQVSMYLRYPWYPSIHLSNYPKKISIQDIQVSGYQKKVVSVHPYENLTFMESLNLIACVLDLNSYKSLFLSNPIESFLMGRVLLQFRGGFVPSDPHVSATPRSSFLIISDCKICYWKIQNKTKITTVCHE